MTRTALLTRLHAPLLLALLLSACASAPPPPSIGGAEIVAAEQAGTLDQLYTEVAAKLADPSLPASSRSQLEATQREIGDKLAAALGDDVQRVLNETPRVDGLLPASAIDAQRARLDPMKSWSPTAYETLSGQLSDEMLKTNAAITERQTALAALDDADLSQQIVLLDEIGQLAGMGSELQKTSAAKRDIRLASLEKTVDQAIEAEDFEKAREMLAIAQEVDPTDDATAEKLATVDTKVFEKRFWQALENGDPDDAYAQLVEISTTDSFDRIRPKLASSTDVMADYYVTLGSEATSQGRASAAYRRFNEARNIRALLGEGTPRPPAAEAGFVKLVEKNFDRARKDDQMGLAWGYLTVIQSLDADSPTLRRHLRETREVVLQRAIKRLTAAPFEDADDSEAKFGDAVASKVVQHLFETIPNDVRIIEREQLGDVMREKSLGGGESTLAAADYLVDGTIQEAKVDSVEKKGKQTKRVVTEQIQQPNPEYNRWVNLDKKQREKTPEPPKTILGDRKEDVSIEVTLHRKVGLFSVSYRVIDATTAKVIFADSVRAKAQYEDTSSEGVELGDFKKEFKLASLPSDVEILAELADQVSEEIGAKLAEVLKDPEVAYAEAGERFESEDNFEAAANEYAYAIVLSERKDEPVEDLKQRLRDAAMGASEP